MERMNKTFEMKNFVCPWKGGNLSILNITLSVFSGTLVNPKIKTQKCTCEQDTQTKQIEEMQSEKSGPGSGSGGT